MSFDHGAAYNLGLTADRQLEAAESDSDTDNASGGVTVLDQLCDVYVGGKVRVANL